MHAEAVLLVDNHQRKTVKLHLLLEDGVRADNHLHLPAGNSLLLRKARFAFLLPGKPAYFNPERRKPGAEIVGVLFSQQLGRRHQRHLFAVGDGAQGGQRGDQGFTGAYVSLHQTHHRHVQRHIALDLGGDPRLRAGGLKGQGGQQLIFQGIVGAERQGVIALGACPQRQHAEVMRQQLFQNQALLRRMRGVLAWALAVLPWVALAWLVRRHSFAGWLVDVLLLYFALGGRSLAEHAQRVADDIDVIINGGPVDTAFTGGDVWKNPKLTETLRAWVRGGGAFVGVGEPSSLARFQAGRFFQLADVIGVDEERYQTLSVDKYFPPVVPDHFITADVPVDPAAREAWEQAGYRIPLSGCGGGQSIKPLGGIDFGEPVLNTYPVNENVTLLRADGGQVQLATNDYGKGRGVYISGLPYSAANARLLERVLFYASHNEDKYAAWSSSNPECEVAHFPEQGLYCVINNTDQPQKTTVTLADGTTEDFDLPDSGIAWREA